jgi:TolB-like protein
MEHPTRSSKIVIFGPFEVRLDTGEIFKNGLRLRLQHQPFQILEALLAQPGEVVTREQLREQLWKNGTFVEFEHGLNAAMNRLRQTLADSVTDPRFIETLPRLGYRFIAPISTSAPARFTAPSAATPSLAVLPFSNIGADPENEYFGDGLAEELLNALVKLPGLKVIARTSSFSFKGTSQDARQIGEALGVAHLLVGSVRRAGNRVRISAQLINARDGYHIWSERYEREIPDVFAIQDEIALAIATALQVKFSEEPDRARRHRPNLPAYEALLRGRFHLSKFTPESWARARNCFEQAIALDPEYSQPHAELGLGYILTATNGMRPMREVAPLVHAHAQRALILKPSDPEPHFLLGTLAAVHDYNWPEAAARFQEAASTSAIGPNTHWAYANFYLGAFGHFQEAVLEMRQAVDKDPIHVGWRAVLTHSLNLAGLHEDAIRQARHAIEIDADHFLPHFTLGEVYLAMGRVADAIAAAERAHRCAPWHPMPTGLLAGALAQAGANERAKELILEMGDSPIPVWGRVLYHLLCSELEAAADWYERMIEQRDPFAVVFACAPVGVSLRQSSRWPTLARMMNLPENGVNRF